jgi:4-hydroxy-4-methyl-2-oxoglutarate aldolase
VLVVQAGGYLGGSWGEILTTAAEARGVAGLVIDGGLRDLEAIERHGFPVFARGTGVFRTGKHVPGDLDVPIVVGSVLIEPGAIMLADADGVLAVPRAALERTLAAARDREARERQVMERLKQGELTLDIYGFPH